MDVDCVVCSADDGLVELDVEVCWEVSGTDVLVEAGLESVEWNGTANENIEFCFGRSLI